MTGDLSGLLKSNAYGVVTFGTTHQALQSEAVLKEAGITFLLIPTPRRISASCGMAVKFFWEDREKILEKLGQKGIKWDKVHRVTKEG
ncbi:MAG: DUF3343 domain-containing protein [Thermoanaerobacteraceae bacterium]|nr:DUF3343 domain-containing protein [Thermoanaerobacteraceae bacterium]